MPRGRPLEGAPGWRVIERPRQSWRAGYVIVPLAVCAGFFLALAPLHPDWPAWPGDEVQEASNPRPLTAREAEILDAAKSEVLASLKSREASTTDVPQDTLDAERLDAERLEPTLLRRGIAYDLPAEDAPLPKLRPSGVESGSLPEEATNPAVPPTSVAPSIRVFIHHTTGAVGTARATRLAAFLRRRGFAVAGIRSVDFQIELPSVRYFFDPDRAGSRHLVEALEAFARQTPGRAPDQPTDFTDFSPKPPPGNVEIWLASQPAGWARSAQADPPS